MEQPNQIQYFIFSARLSHIKKGMKKRWRRKHHAKLVEARAEVQGRGGSLQWALINVAYAKHVNSEQEIGEGVRGSVKM